MVTQAGPDTALLPDPKTGMGDRYPFYVKYVPTSLGDNLLYRREMVRLGDSSRQAASDLWAMCARDLLFYLNTFCWIYEPRTKSVLPFITWPFQNRALRGIEDAIGGATPAHDLSIVKSRDMGASWMSLAVMEHQWHFADMADFGVVSRNQDTVDKYDDPSCLFWKFLFLHEHQPKWLQARFSRTELKVKNLDNGSVLTGTATTGNMFRGARKTAILLDEFAAFSQDDGYRALYSTQAASNCRIYNSTPQGVGNAFYDIAHKPEVRQLRLPWWEHPEKRPGLYRSRDGVLDIVDQSYPFPPDYKFLLDGRVRSPWYDQECARTPIPQLIAQELDMDFLGSGFTYFKKELLDRHEQEYAMPPFQRGELKRHAVSQEPDEFRADESGHLMLWCLLDKDGNPPQTREGYAIGADVSAGTGSSNSVLSVVCRQSGEKVASYVNPNIAPHELAAIAFAMGQWFQTREQHEAFIVPEANGGHNQQFIKTLMELGYGHLYFQQDDKSIAPKRSNKPGWGSGKEPKRLLLERYGKALQESQFINHDAEALNECREYVFFPDGSVDHARSRNVIDPSGAKDNHGDRVIADALACLGLLGARWGADPEPEIPVGSFAWRQKLYQEADDLETADVW